MKLKSNHERALARAKVNKYLILSSRRNNDLETTFFDWCKENEHPCIKIIEGQQFAEIEIDFWETDFIMDANCRRIIHDLYNKHRNANVSLRMSEKDCYLEKLPIGTAYDLIKELMTLFIPFFGSSHRD